MSLIVKSLSKRIYLTHVLSLSLGSSFEVNSSEEEAKYDFKGSEDEAMDVKEPLDVQSKTNRVMS